MKKVALFAFLAAAGLQAAAQNVVITGKVTNPESDSIELAVPDNPFDARAKKVFALLNEKGEFRLAVQVDKPVLADFSNGEDGTTLFLQPGDNLDVRFKGDDILTSIKFKGQGAAENTYLREQEIKFEENEGYQVLPDNIYMREAGFVKFIDAKKEDQDDFLKKYIAKGTLSETFKKFAQAQIDFTWANDRLTYPDLREKIVFADKRLVMTPAYYNFISKLDLNNPVALMSPVYNDFMMNYIDYLAAETKMKKTDLAYFYNIFELAKTKLKGPALNLLQARIIYESCKGGHIGYTERMLNEFNQTSNEPKFAALLTEAYESNKSFAIGSPAPNFTLTTINGDTVSLEDYKGKLVYLTFWETNCGLCLMDMPHAQELTRKMASQQIVFLNVGMDKDEKAWRTMVKGKSLAGVQGLGKTAAEDLRKLYNLPDGPAYFLIAEDGNFLSTKPKRPSNHGATEEIAQSFGKAANTATALNK